VRNETKAPERATLGKLLESDWKVISIVSYRNKTAQVDFLKTRVVRMERFGIPWPVF